MIYKALIIVAMLFIIYWAIFGIEYKGLAYWFKYYLNLIREKKNGQPSDERQISD